MSKEMVKPSALVEPLLRETDELIAILFTSVETAQKGKSRQC